MLVAQDFHYALGIKADDQDDATARWAIAGPELPPTAK